MIILTTGVARGESKAPGLRFCAVEIARAERALFAATVVFWAAFFFGQFQFDTLRLIRSILLAFFLYFSTTFVLINTGVLRFFDRNEISETASVRSSAAFVYGVLTPIAVSAVCAGQALLIPPPPPPARCDHHLSVSDRNPDAVRSP